MSTDFSRNLRFLCAEEGPIAQVCREIGVNRQQFNRYLSGAGLPAAHTLRRIARHFEISEAELFSDHVQFAARHRPALQMALPAGLDHLNAAFRDQARPLRQYLGLYHAYFRTPTWPGQILRTLIQLREDAGLVRSHTFERAQTRDGSIRQRAAYRGLASLRNGRICMVERPRNGSGPVSETVMMPEHASQTSYLQGLTLGVSAGAGRAPFATRTVWVRLGPRIGLREALAATGAQNDASARIDPKVRRLLGEAPPLGLMSAAAAGDAGSDT